MTHVNRHSGGRNPVHILLVEDSAGDARLTEEAFQEANIDQTLHVVTDGDDALDFLNRRGEYGSAVRPDLVLLDLNLPGTDGREILRRIRADEGLRSIPVLVLTGSTASETMIECYESHANAYLTKPDDPDEFASLAGSICRFWFDLVRLPPVPA